MQTVALSESSVAVLRFEIKGWKAKDKGSRLPAYRELAEAGIKGPVSGSETDHRFTADGWARREEILHAEQDRIERERFKPPDVNNLSEAAWALLRRRLAGDRRVTDTNRPLYRELVAARIMYPVSTWAGGPEAVFRFTLAGWERREECPTRNA